MKKKKEKKKKTWTVRFANMPGIISAWEAPTCRRTERHRRRTSKETPSVAGSEMGIGTPECTPYPKTLVNQLARRSL